jgi:hypothetical protein
MMHKLYCYVDETGQDTRGRLFIVSVIVTGVEREQVIELCESIEQTTGKGRVKWIKARYDKRLAYIRRVLQEPVFQGKLYFAVYQDTRDYQSLTIQTIAETILAHARQPYKATVLIDGLPRSRRREVGSRLRNLGIRIRKVRGVRKDEYDALIRLADALCGFVRAAIEGQEAMKVLFEQGKKTGYIKELA